MKFFKDERNLFRFFSGVIIFIVLVAAFGPFLTSADPYATNMTASMLPPSAEHWFGTDKLGRDCFTRIIYGARVSLSMTLVTVVLMSSIGTLIGIVDIHSGKALARSGIHHSALHHLCNASVHSYQTEER